MRIAGFVTDRDTKTPIEDAEVRITREVGGDLIASLPSNQEGTFRWEDELNRHVGQQLVFSVEHDKYFPYQAVHTGEREIAITLSMTAREPTDTTTPVKPPGLLERLFAWFRGLSLWRRLLLIAVPCVICIIGLLAAWLISNGGDGPGPDRLSCDKPSIQRAATPADPALLQRIAEACAQANNLPLQFEAVEACSRHGNGICLITMGGWYDPTRSSEPTPFTQRNPALAAQYYRRARTEGVEDARTRLDGLCRALREQGGQAAADASC